MHKEFVSIYGIVARPSVGPMEMFMLALDMYVCFTVSVVSSFYVIVAFVCFHLAQPLQRIPKVLLGGSNSSHPVFVCGDIERYLHSKALWISGAA